METSAGNGRSFLFAIFLRSGKLYSEYISFFNMRKLKNDIQSFFNMIKLKNEMKGGDIYGKFQRVAENDY